MVGYYRIRELGFRLASGAHIIPKATFEPVAESSAIVDAARQLAATIIEDSQRTFEEMKQRGYAEGTARARVEAVERLIEEQRVLDASIAALETDVSELVIAAVRSLVDTFDDNAKAEILVRASVRQMRREKKAELRVSREQYEYLRKIIGTIVADFPEVELVDVVADDGLVSPQIIVETAIGRVEGDMGRNMDDLALAIRNAAGARQVTDSVPERAVAASGDAG
ncbi:type III secretion system stator protein SctL [Mesorhizobium sp. ANAO-SY3R2]|uniref:type III secretion system stator protein SctL n=1 Tax=Mesorhizobium sp. ANAO-SY3R2 TaxID=3166644 RepID=UPI00366D3B13